MVAHTRTAGGAGRLRPLNRPRQIQVEADQDQRPLTVHISGSRRAVESLLERWRIDDEWWRQRQVSRLYFRLLLEDGRTLDIYRDLKDERWWRQAY